jgi:hypothetical protein
LVRIGTRSPENVRFREVTSMGDVQLGAMELGLLRAVREADEESGGMIRGECNEDERDVLDALVERGLVECRSEYGEAPDGEEDEADEGARYGGMYRITGAGVEALRDAG